ncbi:MAG: hypothetical protein H5T69_09355 [Chloroflexi bacterium]|nr:hypothetical protein [Chloroflexota bacterium]
MARPDDRWADRFAQDVDALLRARDRGAEEPPPEEYERALQVARWLADLDLAAESRERDGLRRRLLDRAAKRPHAARRPWRAPFALLRGAALAGLWALCALTLLAAVTLAWPGGLTVSIQRLEDSIYRLMRRQALPVYVLAAERITPGQQLQVRRPAPNQVVLIREGVAPVTFITGQQRAWFISTPIGSFGGSAFPELDDRIWRLQDIREAQRRLRFPLRQPTYLPEGYALREAVVSPLDSAHLIYDGPAHEIVVVQMRVADHPALAERLGHPLALAWTTVTDKPVEWVELDHQPASWIEGTGLLWEANDMSYLVGGISLSFEEARRIALSLR